MLRYLRWLAVFVIGVWLFVSCGPPEIPYEVPKDVFAKDSPESDRITLEHDGESLEVFKDRLILLLKEGITDAKSGEAVAKALGGEVVGQIPSLGLYQLSVKADTYAAFEALRTKALGLSDVEDVAFQTPVTMAAEPDPACKLQDDITKLPKGPLKCAWETIQYEHTVAVLEKLKGALTYHPVRVAVIDSGVEEATLQFEQVKLLNLTAPGEKLKDAHGHGTVVAGIIAADKDDGGTNGIASRILGDKLTLISVTRGLRDSFSVLVFLEYASKYAKADVINGSYGKQYKEAFKSWFGAYRKAVKRQLQAHPEVLFVVAAGNENFKLEGENYYPGGIQLPHVLTVGGSDKCDPLKKAPNSNYGPQVDIVAPYYVPVLNYWKGKAHALASGPPQILGGTSLSAPIVSAIAALVKSLKPSMAAKDIATFLKKQVLPADAKFIWGRTSMGVPLLQHVFAEFPNDAVRTLLVTEKDETRAQSVSMVYLRMCGGGTLSVENNGEYSFSGDEQGLAAWSETGLHLPLTKTGKMGFIMHINSNGLKPGETYKIPEHVTVSFTRINEGSYDYAGTGVAGQVHFDRCEIIERDPAGSLRPWTLAVFLRASGTIDMFDVVPFTTPVPRGFDLIIRANVVLYTTSAELVKHVEAVCQVQ